MRFPVAAAAVLFFLFTPPGSAQTHDPYDKLVPHGHDYESFEEAIKLIETRTGLKVICPSDTSTLIQKLWSKGKSSSWTIDAQRPEISVRDFVWEVCSDFALMGKIHPEDGSVVIDIPWRTSDPRPGATLLNFISTNFCGRDYGAEMNEKWQQAFDALLCKPENLEKALAVRQVATLKDVLGPSPSNLLLNTPIVGVGGAKYRLLLFRHPLLAVPGAGTASYYWFRNDGTLAGGGIMHTGNCCVLVDAAIDNESGPRRDQTSEVQMILKRDGFLIARFVLEQEGLKLVRLIDATGEEAKIGYQIGEPLFKRVK